MKSIKVAVLFSLLAIASTSSAATLSCWNTYNKGAQTQPYMTAGISSSGALSNILFDEMHYDNVMDASSAPQVVGQLITSNHSPYAGYNSFPLAHGSVLILPTDLTQNNLADIGRGFFSDYDGLGSGINAIIIGYNQDDGEGGGHYSVRMHCESNL